MRIRTPHGSGQIGYRPTRRRHDFGGSRDDARPLRTFVLWVLAAAAAAACIAFPPATTVAPQDAPSAAVSLRQASSARS